jgi:hypothetical protein
LAGIDAKLSRLGLPPVDVDADELPRPQVAMMWVPQTEGTPNIRANSARAYWPGRPRVRMLLYNQGNRADGPFRLSRYPASRAAIRKALRKPRYLGLPGRGSPRGDHRPGRRPASSRRPS